LAVLTEAREAGRGAVAAIVTDVAVVIPTVMTSAPAATFTVEEDVLALVRARPTMTDTIVPRDGADVTMTDALAVIATAVAVLVAGAPPSPLNSMKMNGINELFLCSSLPHV
jgi:hypothetical protein